MLAFELTPLGAPASARIFVTTYGKGVARPQLWHLNGITVAVYRVLKR